MLSLQCHKLRADEAQVDGPSSKRTDGPDEEKTIETPGGGGLPIRILKQDPASQSEVEVTDPWEVRFEEGEEINPKVR